MRKIVKVTGIVIVVLLVLGSVGFNGYTVFVGWRTALQERAFTAGVQTAAMEIVKQAEAGSAKIGLDEGKRVVELVVKTPQPSSGISSEELRANTPPTSSGPSNPK